MHIRWWSNHQGIRGTESDSESARAEQHPVRRPTVLLLDDEDTVRQSLGRYLELSGFDVVSAATADEAFEHLRKRSVNALILDVHLPARRSGLEVLQFVRLDESAHDVPVIVLTGNVLTTEEEDIVRRYSAYVFYKPHGYGELISRLRQLCAAPAHMHRAG